MKFPLYTIGRPGPVLVGGRRSYVQQCLSRRLK